MSRIFYTLTKTGTERDASRGEASDIMVWPDYRRWSRVIRYAKVLFCLAALLTVCYAERAPQGWRVYHSLDYSFSIAYPANMTFYSGHPDLAETGLSYIPICDYTTVACFEYNGKEYGSTNLQAAGLSINVLRNEKAEQDCTAIDASQYPVKTQIINGTTFRYGLTGEAGLGNSKGGTVYRAFHDGVCFEISAATAQSSLGAFDPGTVKAFDSGKLDGILDQMVHTFKFEGPVKDGADWDVYYDGMCGGIYEYPRGETIRTTTEYSEAGYHSNAITCSRHFTHNGLDYTIAVKVNLGDRGGLEAWLRSSDYPNLVNAEALAGSKYCSAYKTGPYYYIFGQTTLFILSVSDAKHSVVTAFNDPVFRHLFKSFKVL